METSDSIEHEGWDDPSDAAVSTAGTRLLTEKKQVTFADGIVLTSGKTITPLTVAYETFGTLLQTSPVQIQTGGFDCSSRSAPCVYIQLYANSMGLTTASGPEQQLGTHGKAIVETD